MRLLCGTCSRKVSTCPERRGAESGARATARQVAEIRLAFQQRIPMPSVAEVASEFQLPRWLVRKVLGGGNWQAYQSAADASLPRCDPFAEPGVERPVLTLVNGGKAA